MEIAAENNKRAQWEDARPKINNTQFNTMWEDKKAQAPSYNSRNDLMSLKTSAHRNFDATFVYIYVKWGYDFYAKLYETTWQIINKSKQVYFCLSES